VACCLPSVTGAAHQCQFTAESGTRWRAIWVNVLLWRSPVAGSGRGGPDPATGALLCGPGERTETVGGAR